MLERMGWSEGKGLGKDLAGKTEHVKVSKRSDTSGLCYVTPCNEKSHLVWDVWLAITPHLVVLTV